MPALATDVGKLAPFPHNLRPSQGELMIPAPPQPRYAPGTRVRVTQKVRVGHRAWSTQVEGVVEKDGHRPVGGVAMGGKASYCLQPTLRLRSDTGEITAVALDDDTEVETLG